MESKDTPTKEKEQSKLINSDKLQNLKKKVKFQIWDTAGQEKYYN